MGSQLSASFQERLSGCSEDLFEAQSTRKQASVELMPSSSQAELAHALGHILRLQTA